MTKVVKQLRAEGYWVTVHTLLPSTITVWRADRLAGGVFGEYDIQQGTEFIKASIDQWLDAPLETDNQEDQTPSE